MRKSHLYSLVYRSRVARLLTEPELVLLLNRARAKNERLGVTGILLHCEGQFVQLLEGDENEVIDLYQTIARDTRHSDVTLLTQGTIEARATATWPMGFRRTAPHEIEALPGFADFLEGWDDLPDLVRPEDWSERLLTLFKMNGSDTSTPS